MVTRRYLTRLLVVGAVGVAALGLSACGKSDSPTSASGNAASDDPGAFSVLAGSELRDIEPRLIKAANDAGVRIKLTYAGTLDMVERVNAGERFDAILPPNGAYPGLALSTRPIAREKLFYSRVAMGVKADKLKELGWDKRNPNWADIAQAAGSGKLRYAMTNPASSNTGMSAFFAVASAVAGKTEDLEVKDVDTNTLKVFLSGQKLTAGSSGWLAEAYANAPGGVDAMVNYEAVILRGNEKLSPAERLSLIYPQDGVISADYPLMLLQADKRDSYNKLIAAFKSEPFQREIASAAFLRPAIPNIALSPGLSTASVVELSFPNRLEVIDHVLSAYQGDLRRPATSIFVLDVSGSMAGARLSAMRDALKILAGGDQANNASTRYARFQNREHVVLIAFSDRVRKPVYVDFGNLNLEAARAKVQDYADHLDVDGGTGIYAALLTGQDIARKELLRDPNRFVSMVLLTDGANNAGPGLPEFKESIDPNVPVRIFPILFGEASSEAMNTVAQLTGGRVFDGRKASLPLVFKEIRGYQ